MIVGQWCLCVGPGHRSKWSAISHLAVVARETNLA